MKTAISHAFADRQRCVAVRDLADDKFKVIVDVACNFEEGSITSQERVDEYKKELNGQGISTYQIPIPRSFHHSCSSPPFFSPFSFSPSLFEG